MIAVGHGLRTRFLSMAAVLALIAGLPGSALAQDWEAQTIGNSDLGWTGGRLGNVFRSTDGALTWTGEPTLTLDELNAVHFADAFHGWAVGDNGTILCRGDVSRLTEVVRPIDTGPPRIRESPYIDPGKRGFLGTWGLTNLVRDFEGVVMAQAMSV